MGQVYKVKHLYLDKELALKCLAINETDLKLRFTNEARALAKLSHPNIVQIYDLFADNHGRLCYSMELIKGISFSRFLKQRGPLSEQLTAAIFAQVFDALQYAHKAGITHRDIKPSNIMLIDPHTTGKTPTAMLVDFGLVKMQEDYSAQGLTREGEILGSPLYMSPEQCAGGPIGPASDLYSAGCSMYEALTGRLPFTGNTLPLLWKKANSAVPPLSDLVPERMISPLMEDLIMGLLEVNPRDRPGNAAAVARILKLIAAREIDSSDYRNTYKALLSSADSAEAEANQPLDDAPADDQGGGTTTTINRREQFKITAIATTGVLFCLICIGWCIAGVMQAAHHARKQNTSTTIAPFAHYVQRGSGRILAVDTNIGKLKNYDHLGVLVAGRTEGHPIHSLAGQFELPLSDWTLLRVDSSMINHPELLEGLPDDLLDAIEPVDGATLTQDFLEKLPYCKNLAALKIMGININDECLPILDKLPKLSSLSMGRNQITAAGLAQSKFLPKLIALKIHQLKDLDLLLDALAKQNNLHILTLNSIPLTHETIAKIAMLKELQELGLAEIDIEEDLSPLTTLPKLTNLELRESNITMAGWEAISKIKSLEKVHMGSSYMTNEDVQKLKQMMPGVLLDINPDASLFTKTAK